MGCRSRSRTWPRRPGSGRPTARRSMPPSCRRPTRRTWPCSGRPAWSSSPKTNTPEFGAGSQTFNPVFGPTRNPLDTRLTPGGSSGGAAAAVAAGLLPFADGSDVGASVRNPAAFC
ncbi:MAG: amidase family protein, partial [Streptosporangiaceae bacterium]